MVDRLDADFEAEQSGRDAFLDKLHDIRVQDIGGDFELKDILWSVVIEDKLERPDGEIAFDIERAVEKFDRTAVFHQLEQGRVNMFLGQVADFIVEACQAKFAFIRASAGSFHI
ncbi:MAG: hypothetical protein ACK559_31120, partial [bacterium]